jgi:LEA14-like dessication related protein
MTKRLLSAALLLPALPALVGCEALEEFTPTVQYDNLDVQEIDWTRIDSDFNFRVNNPNPVDIELARFDYDLGFEGINWLSGDNPDGLALEASGDTAWALPVSVGFDELYEVVQAVRGEDEISFELAGSFGFDTKIGPIDIPYDASGEFPALRRPKFSLGKLNVGSINWSNFTVDLGLELGVDNELGSNLAFWNMDYGIDIAGTRITSGFLASLGDVDGDSAATVEIPFEVDLLNLAGAAYDVIVNKEPASVGLDAALEVDTPFGVVPLALDLSEGTLTIE